MQNFPSELQILTESDFDRITANSTALEEDHYGIKVYLLENKNILKVFRKRSFFSSATLYPHHKRFSNNADSLKQLDIATVSIENIYDIPQLKLTGVCYSPLEGATLREIARKEEFTSELALKTGEFISLLHYKGIFFRSLHLGNIILGSDGSLGLIDLVDMKFTAKALSLWQRKRNFTHLLRYENDKKLLGDQCIDELLKSYFKATETQKPLMPKFKQALKNLAQPKLV